MESFFLFVLTSGTAAGDNVVPTGSVIIIDYYRSTPLIKTIRDNTSIAAYGLKKKEITDKNINDLCPKCYNEFEVICEKVKKINEREEKVFLKTFKK